MSEPNDDSDIPSTIPCQTCGKAIPFSAMEGRTKFGLDAMSCPDCNGKGMTFVEVTTEVDPDS